MGQSKVKTKIYFTSIGPWLPHLDSQYLYVEFKSRDGLESVKTPEVSEDQWCDLCWHRRMEKVLLPRGSCFLLSSVRCWFSWSGARQWPHCSFCQTRNLRSHPGDEWHSMCRIICKGHDKSVLLGVSPGLARELSPGEPEEAGPVGGVNCCVDDTIAEGPQDRCPHLWGSCPAPLSVGRCQMWPVAILGVPRVS